VHYTAEFFCANMTVEMDDTDKLKVLFEDALKLGLRFEPPDVNRGSYRFEPVSDTVIRYGLGAIKGTGEQAIEAITRARGEGGPFTQPVRLLRAGRPHAAEQALPSRH
jgi:DNA polymerase-3 subunit alpha